MSHLLVSIDPDTHSHHWLEELEKDSNGEIHLKLFKDPDLGWDFVQTHGPEINGVILETFLGTGCKILSEQEKETVDVLENGTLVGKKIREKMPQLPIAFLTHSRRQRHSTMYQTLEATGYPIFCKYELMPFEFASQLAEIWKLPYQFPVKS